MQTEVKKHFQALFFFIVIFLIVLAPVLFFGRAFGQADAIEEIYSVLHFFKSALVGGESIFFSSNIFSGFPTFILGSYFNPFYFLLKFLSVFTVYNWTIFLNLVVAGFLLYLFLKKLDLPHLVSIFGGLTYAFSLWAWIPNMGLISALPILPALFLLLHSYHYRRSWWKIFIGGMLIGYAVYVVNFNLMPIILIGAGLYSLALLRGSDRKARDLLKTPLALVLMAVAGVIIGWPQFSATMLYSSLSARSAGFDFTTASEGALQMFDFAKYLLPYTELPMFVSSSYMYLGILPLFFLIFSFFKKDKARTVFVVLFFLSIVIAIKYSPVFWLMLKLPFLDRLRVPGRWILLAAFSGSILASFGLRNILEYAKENTLAVFLKVYKYIIFLTVIVLSIFTVIFKFFKEPIQNYFKNYFVERVYSETSGLPIDHYFSVIESMFDQLAASVSFFNLKVLLPVLFFILGYVILRQFQRKKILVGKFVVAVVLITAANFIFVLWPYHETVAQKSFTERSEIVTYLQENQGKYFVFMPGFSEFQKLTTPYRPSAQDALEFQRVLLPPNYSFYYNLQAADYYDNLMSRRMSRILALLGSDRATAGEKLSDEKIPIEEKIKKFEERKPLLSLIGVEYIISVYELDERLFKKIMEVPATRFEIPVYLYKTEPARPPVYLADTSVIIKPSEEESYNLATTLDLKARDIIVECEGDCLSTTSQARGTVEVSDQKNGFWKISVDTPDERWLVVSENFLPGWQARVDGEEVEIYYINSVFMGLSVSQGQHEIIIKYHYPF